jgi:hypothetical protein
MRFGVIALAALAATSAWADSQFRVRRTARAGIPFGKGQCDIRLQVDDEVEVSVRGDTVFLRTVSGREARDDGSECNLPLPSRDIRGFAFEVKDKRNQIGLTQTPDSSNGFTAVVRIRDTNSGYGRYRFRLAWIDSAGPGPDVARPPVDGFSWNNVTHYSGRGTGSAVYSDADPRRLSGISLDIDRSGHALVSFQTGDGSALVLNGTVIGREGERLKVDAMTDDQRLHGTMWIAVSGADIVRTIDLEATDGRDRVVVHWDRR